MSKEVGELQGLEGNAQQLLMQKQTIQIELNEIENAIKELEGSGDEVYRVISGVMIKSTKKKIGEDLDEKKKVLESKIEAIEKQGKLIEARSSELRKEVLKKSE